MIKAKNFELARFFRLDTDIYHQGGTAIQVLKGRFRVSEHLTPVAGLNLLRKNSPILPKFFLELSLFEFRFTVFLS